MSSMIMSQNFVPPIYPPFSQKTSFLFNFVLSPLHWVWTDPPFFWTLVGNPEKGFYNHSASGKIQEDILNIYFKYPCLFLLWKYSSIFENFPLVDPGMMINLLLCSCFFLYPRKWNCGFMRKPGGSGPGS